MKYTADFETTTDLDDCRVWAYGICEIGKPENFIYGNDIADFIYWCKKQRNNPTLYFHNLKFDGEFIISWLLNNNYMYVKDKKEAHDGTFTCLISEMGQFYSLEIYFKVPKISNHIKKVTIYDSLKILNFSVEHIAKCFNLPIRKLEINYQEKREKGHILTDEEIDYLRNDVEIMARALKIMFDQNMDKMTIGSDALKFYKEMTPNFEKLFPILNYEIDKDIRKAYKGGFTYLNPIYKEKEVGEGIVLDVNSLYPSVMLEPLPYDEPIYFEGKYEEDILYPLYVQRISCIFEIKEHKIPTIQIKKSTVFAPNEFLESSNGDIVTLTLTNIDLELFLEQYNVYDLEYHSGWKFKKMKGLFDNYISHWTEVKINSKKEGNGAMYQIAKLMLNSLYGKLGLNPNVQSKYPVLEDGIVKYKLHEKEIREPIYIPAAAFITAYARNKTIRTSQKIKDYTRKNLGIDLYYYSDTDSIHTGFTDEKVLKEIIEIDDYKLGAWKLESTFKKAKFIRQKCYVEIGDDDTSNVTVAGLPKKLGHLVDFDKFKKGLELSGKLVPKHVPGGIVLVDTTFSIK